ncbi:triose-phosphate isomerase, partial [Anaerostipes butyraticus]|uniref:triose-phosphate isomerase n=1 Tax=Anaerostipes butyraticus TaxID=645466 RepID=UPI0023A7B4E2
MAKAESPFLIVNPKSYLYGKESLELAKASDQVAADTGLQIYFTCPYADIRMIKENTSHLIVCAQSMDPLAPGRGMGHVLPESLKEAGAEAVFLNHAENQKTVSELYHTIQRAKELGMITVV